MSELTEREETEQKTRKRKIKKRRIEIDLSLTDKTIKNGERADHFRKKSKMKNDNVKRHTHTHSHTPERNMYE